MSGRAEVPDKRYPVGLRWKSERASLRQAIEKGGPVRWAHERGLRAGRKAGLANTALSIFALSRAFRAAEFVRRQREAAK